jgi:hypothetical protein
MSPRDTRTGAVLEQMILPSLVRCGYQYQVQTIGSGKHRVDVIAQKGIKVNHLRQPRVLP